MARWYRFANGKAGCLRGTYTSDKAAGSVAEKKMGSTVIAEFRLPYPAEPLLDEAETPGECPPFCYTPEKCKGRGSCPKSYACSE